MKFIKLGFLSSVFLLAGYGFVYAQDIHSLPNLGKLQTLSAKEIESSRWSIGGETLDRDYADYHAYKEYLGPLGAKRIRLQGGWAKCEKEKGKYDFEWLDIIVDDALSQGVNPWLQTSYGNPIYEGGGDAALAGGIPTTYEALQAWDRWVEALVSRYKDKVIEWEIWNEPDISKKFTPLEFAEFHVRTADIIKKVQPGARIIALGLAGPGNVKYVQSILDILKSKNKLEYFDALSFHGYTPVPETSYVIVSKLRVLLNNYNSGIELWQGENGAPSTPKGQSVGALRQFDWSEISQAKWVLRRMLGDMANGVDVTSIFQISDMYYGQGDHMEGYNSKGLLLTNPDKSIERPKLSYYTYQTVATLFSGEISKTEVGVKTMSEENLKVFAFKRTGKKGDAITIWNGLAKPEDSMETVREDFVIRNIKLSNPVLLDLFDGTIYELPKGSFQRKGKDHIFKNIPIGDWPIAIVDRSWVNL
ncbi:GH39 family glycosyl hydrolase [Aquiflexum lacus]|uniref:GH39 family glycosyl hydrolase n=1 Tax=Aquiflexum lacus TaxID=2483805 RepID=UPI0018932C08|nr:hypothetical protein [Aquiflexum lacus]